MVEASPSASLVVPEPDFLLELLIVTLDPPAHLGDIDELAEADLCRQSGEPVFGRLVLVLGPFNQQPLLCDLPGNCTIVPDAHAHTGKARGEPIGRAFAPADRAPGMLGQTDRHLLGRDQTGLVAPSRVIEPFARP